tara:strand:- start:1821 stop:3590 length:1770 start_codon:yes stop_codon:yes gene_type:complete
METPFLKKLENGTRLFLSLLVLNFTLFSAVSCKKDDSFKDFSNRKITHTNLLEDQKKQFVKGVYKVTDGVYVAVGFGLANSILILGPTGKVIIDVMGDMKRAKEVKKEFDKISSLPLKGIIYTHNHSDHIFGGEAFSEGKEIPVYAHKKTKQAIDKIISKLELAIRVRSYRMFGNFLNKEHLSHAGIGPFLEINDESQLGLLYPTHTFEKKLEINIGGLDIELNYAPGETDDQIFVYIPSKKALFPGDNYYHSFPNLYTIRGTAYRDVRHWSNSLDLMIKKKPHFLIPSHTMPLKGEETIRENLSNYRDAIRFVHDQTIRGINKGMTPDELVEFVKLPEVYTSKPYLAEVYGKVEWAVRSIFSGHLGWFNGHSKSLYSIPKNKRSHYFKELLGGKENLFKAAKQAFTKKRYLFSLELIDLFLNLEPKNKSGKNLKKEILIKLSEKETNINARHYFLTRAQELEQDNLPYGRPKLSNNMVDSLDLKLVFDIFSVNFAQEKAEGLKQRVGFEFTNPNQSFTLLVRNGVAKSYKGLIGKLDVHMKCPSRLFKNFIVKNTSVLKLLATCSYPIGNSIKMARFLSLFKPSRFKN